jgi:hypothetical protein
MTEGWTQLHSDVIGWLFAWRKRYLAIISCWDSLQNIMAAEHIGFCVCVCVCVCVCYLEEATTAFSFRPTQKFSSILPYSQPSYSNYESSVFPQHFWHHRPTFTSVYQSFLLQLIILFTELSLSIFTICPIHLIFYAFIHLAICARLVSNSICSLVLIFQLPIIRWLPS